MSTAGPQRRRSSVGIAMDSLKIAANKVKKSPKALKCKIDNALNKDKLTDNWIHNRENVQNGVVFNMKVLGKKVATTAQGKGCTDDAVKEMVQQHKVKGKTEKLLKVSMRVDSKKMIIRDLVTHELLEDVPVNRISYCTADPNFPKVFALIARERGSKTLFTHAFLTNKKEMAEAIALTVAQAFTMAYEEWDEKSKERQREVEDEQASDALELYKDLASESPKPDSNPFKKEDQEDDFNFISSSLAPRVQTIEIVEPLDNETHSDGASSDDDEFSRLARDRSASDCGRLDTGLVRRETFKGNVSNFLAVNVTLADLDLAKSTEDLTQISTTQISPTPSPIPSPQPSPRRNRNRGSSNPGSSNPFSNNLTYEAPPAEPSSEDNLIQF
ncbi:low density lipoprotein receptor adapter protein 1-like isoform X2 [Clytia hemisphaerica]|uniref:low density lipoprotein receptor adapter protein 1-like isoform X2 n=1 Tax=Clytia hemisphaerica TaxID=252671 RepID=UPI0034D530C2